MRYFAKDYCMVVGKVHSVIRTLFCLLPSVKPEMDHDFHRARTSTWKLYSACLPCRRNAEYLDSFLHYTQNSERCLSFFCIQSRNLEVILQNSAYREDWNLDILGTPLRCLKKFGWFFRDILHTAHKHGTWLPWMKVRIQKTGNQCSLNSCRHPFLKGTSE